MKFGSHVKCALFCTDLNHKKKLGRQIQVTIRYKISHIIVAGRELLHAETDGHETTKMTVAVRYRTRYKVQ
jgi:hypothetical protein